jgi:hypothetical protein
LTAAIDFVWNRVMRRPKSTPPEKPEHEWAITLIRQRGKFLGYVRAPDAETAIQEAIKHLMRSAEHLLPSPRQSAGRGHGENQLKCRTVRGLRCSLSQTFR